MNLPELQQQIKNNNLQDKYIFTGEEVAVQKIYIHKIASMKKMEIVYVDFYKQIIDRLSGTDLFGTKALYVVVNDTDILKQESVWNDISTNGNIIIFKYDSLDKRGKFFHYFEDIVVDFPLLSNDVLTMYIQKEIDLCKDYCDELIDICGSNYNRILLEIDKIKNYDIHGEHNYDDYFVALDMQGAFNKDVADIIFEFIEQVMLRRVDNIGVLQKQLTQIGESNLKVITLLYNNFKTILLIQCCKSNDISKTTGLQGNQIYYGKQKTGHYSNSELVYILRLLQKAEHDIKIGLLEESIALDYVLVNII